MHVTEANLDCLYITRYFIHFYNNNNRIRFFTISLKIVKLISQSEYSQHIKFFTFFNIEFDKQ